MEFQPPEIAYFPMLPVILMAGWGLIMMVIDMFVPDENSSWTPWFALAGPVLALLASLTLWGQNIGTFIPFNGEPMVLIDNYSTFLNIIFCLTAILTILMSVTYLRRAGLERAEFYLLILFSATGMMLMGMANDLILIFVALEVLSIPLYIMSGMASPRPESEESAMKYFLLGAFSSGIFVFGIALTYGATASTSLPVVLANIGDGGALGFAGAAFLLVGLGFKVAVTPFHMWTPDVYEGAPTVVTAFMSVGAKVGGFGAMLRVFAGALPEIGDAWVPATVEVAALTLIVGNVVAIAQPHIKRMLAYSSIAHAGYIMMAVAASSSSPDGVSSALFYMFAYLFTNLGAFAIVIALEKNDNQGLQLDDYKGLATRSPLVAMALAYFMFSFTGIPLTGGFAGKFFVFRASIEAGLIGLTIVGVLTSVVSGFYYLRDV